MQLSVIAEANGNDDFFIVKYGTTKVSAFANYIHKGGCGLDPPTVLIASPNQSGALSGIQGIRATAQADYVDAVKNNLSDAVIKQRKRDIIKASEDAGEAAADAYFVTTLGYTSLTCSYPNTTGSGDVKQGVFDRVYAKYSGTTITEVIVVECKGGVSPLGCRNGKKQGTKAYLLDIILNMKS